ncbi:hypothetical protein [Mycobacterium sp.]|uniref:hypothetical protein n=1 Tax=Mycobacterium sp. TaxID=1785 RepID=UPI003F9E82F4
MNDAGGASSGSRSPAARTLIATALSTAVVLGGAFLAVDRLHSSTADAVEHPGPAATDAQTQTEVVEQARDIVAIAGLHQATAGYLLMSCKNRDDPPYQGAVYMDFRLPADASADEYFRSIAAVMASHGWREGLPPNQHLFGRNLSKDGVNAILYPDSDSPGHGVARIYGQCHDMNTHRNDSTAWVDVTDRLH